MLTLPDWVHGAPGAVLQDQHTGRWSLKDLAEQVDAYATILNNSAVRRVGILADNSAHWIAVDLAAHRTSRTLIPLPDFFTAAQLAHAAIHARVDGLFCADERQAASLGFTRPARGAGGLAFHEREAAVDACALPDPFVQKITFTSGTTGAPKGVCLTAARQIDVARAIAAVTGSLGIRRHLHLLPFAILLENVAGVYASLMMGATCICASPEETGLAGASRFDTARCLGAIERHAPDSIILLPQMLTALVAELERTHGADPRVRSLRFVAVGGARTPAPLILRARELGLPVYEGYGLSECASVVALNVPGADRPGTVGRCLPGTTVRVAADSELEVSGRGFCGYLEGPSAGMDEWLKTGDVGSVDPDGFISITGRKKNILVTTFGRNISPEWPEGLLLASPLVPQAAVFGDARPFLVAVIVAVSSAIDDHALEQLVNATNQTLPDYARVARWVRATEPFTPANGLATANGRVRRDAVLKCYEHRLNDLYQTESEIS